MRLPESLFTTPLAQAGWVAAYNRAGQAIELAAGGTEPRYRLWGSYQLNERPADVLGRMLACCDGRLVPTPDGGLTLDIGEWAEPTVILTADAITGFSDVGRGRDVMTTANTIRATFLDPTQDYQSTDADPWADEDAVSERGEEAKDVQFNMAPSHSQARRLMKLEWFRANPNWVGTFNTNLMGLAAFGERFIRIHYSLFGIDSVFEVLDFKFIIGEGGILQGATIQVQSMPSTAYQWDSSQEGEAPVSSETDVDDGIPVPAAPVIAIKAGPSAELTFSPSSSVLLNYMVRWRKTSDTEWTVYGPLANEAQSLTIPNLAAATQYEFQMALRTEKGRLGSYGPSAVETTPAVDS
ncbi:fibronectin type III domain-containing protein [Brucella pseudogrignonensis]|nr:fibronectin type III domain-containing protein [Brucella pseudogrignonensis]MDT6938559.1 fibronectin type III domain-containing protein [Brucella pseudogrignonensis]MDT6942580.1 fibronectin type III domain-containing protein [Brucella pseudogrignonensis]MDT6942622.1 fibronectin type III domain-containing protein [Brucella pseudogrignonensis]